MGTGRKKCSAHFRRLVLSTVHCPLSTVHCPLLLQTDLITSLVLKISSDKQATESNKHQTQNDPSQ
jgi:hypothetical protein